MSRNALFLLLKAGVSAGLIAWLATRIDLDPLRDAFATLDPAWTALALAFLLAQLVLAGLRWSRIHGRLGQRLGPRDAVELAFVGQFFNQTLPSAIGGDAVRAILAAKRGLTAGQAASGVILDRGLALIVLIALMALASPVLPAREAAWLAGVALATLAALAAGLYLAARARRFLPSWRAVEWAYGVAEGLRAILARPRLLLVSLIVHLGVIATFWALARALDVPAGFALCVAAVPPIVLLSTLPISLAGWGVREGAAVYVFGLAGIAAADALALSVAFGVAQIAIGLPGLALWLKGRRDG
ncbi:MAG: flippase-like domain-containing protein [Tagaea sp.]|nr:flippase-like domain-containing protein [Tagaea sp.]